MTSFRRACAGGAAVLPLVLALVAGCTARAPAPDAGVETSSTRGPIRLTVRCVPATVGVGDKLTLTVEVEAEAGLEVEMPAPEETLGPFAVRRADRPLDVPDADRRRWTHTYVLDTFAAGPAEIPALTARYTDRRPGATGADAEALEGEITSEPLTIDVRSVLRGDESETDLRDIRAEVEVPVTAAATRRTALLAAALLLGTVVLLLALWWRRRRRGPAPAVVVAPDVWARAELEALAARGLIEREAYQAFYVALTDIVRQYIERRFGLMAPERTTQEFLREAREDAALSGDHQTRLGAFLRAADMVKFAKHRPSAGESRGALDAAREFVAETAPSPTPVAAGATEAQVHPPEAAA